MKFISFISLILLVISCNNTEITNVLQNNEVNKIPNELIGLFFSEQEDKYYELTTRNNLVVINTYHPLIMDLKDSLIQYEIIDDEVIEITSINIEDTDNNEVERFDFIRLDSIILLKYGNIEIKDNIIKLDGIEVGEGLLKKYKDHLLIYSKGLTETNYSLIFIEIQSNDLLIRKDFDENKIMKLKNKKQYSELVSISIDTGEHDRDASTSVILTLNYDKLEEVINLKDFYSENKMVRKK